MKKSNIAVLKKLQLISPPTPILVIDEELSIPIVENLLIL